jgi:hypothetical protein
MRKQHRAATVILAALVALPLFNNLIGSALADPATNDDRTDSQTYTEARADYWQARAEYDARREATRAKKEAGGTTSNPDSPAQAVTALKAEAPVAAVAAVPVAEGYPTNAQLAALRMCESTDRYFVNTGNGYYGAYQFSAVTWWWLGYSGYPHEASPAVQDQAVRDLYALMGWSPWPACSRSLGFR